MHTTANNQTQNAQSWKTNMIQGEKHSMKRNYKQNSVGWTFKNNYLTFPKEYS